MRTRHRVTILPMYRVAVGGAVCAACACMGYAVRGRSSTLLGPSVYRGCRRRRSIALTFDDGPSEGTNELLDILYHYRTPATIFVCMHDGRGVRANPDISATLNAVEQLIPVLRSRGFTFETVSQLLCPTN